MAPLAGSVNPRPDMREVCNDVPDRNAGLMDVFSKTGGTY